MMMKWTSPARACPAGLLRDRPPRRFAFRDRLLLQLCLLLLPTLSCSRAAGRAERDLSALRLPPGFHVSVYVDGVPGARSLARGERGALFIGTRDEGKVYAVRDRDGDGKPDEVRTLLQGLREPNGVAVQGGALYVAEISRVLRVDRVEDQLGQAKAPQPAVVYAGFPTDGHHGWKFIRFGPDGLLYVPVGAPCNLCQEPDPYASITRLQPGGAPEVFARGIRNTVGFDWHPSTGALWFTDNGRDLLGDDVPPDELNVAPRPGLHFGFPHCHAGDIADPEFGAGHPCARYTPPAIKLGPHVAALGMRFYTGAQFPARYKNQIFIAEHGSWNRSQPIGYRVTLVRLSDDGTRAISYEPFLDGFLQGNKASGRPVDLLVLPDGSLLVSDDRAGCVYRVTYDAAQAAGR